MKPLNKDGARDYLRTHGVPESRIEGIVGAFDFELPVYEQPLESGQEVFQYVRNSSTGDPSSRPGNWFCIRGARLNHLAIFGGGAGRRLERYFVAHSFRALEGSASPMSDNWRLAIGGDGGGTQIYVPSPMIGRLHAAGSHEEW